MREILNQLKIQANSHHLRVVAFALLGAVVGALLVALLLSTGQTVEISSTEISTTTATAMPEQVVADPVLIRIPAVNIEAEFEGSVGLNNDQTIGVPDSFEEVVWYRFGPKPGGLGPAVVLGHVDSYQGPAVFYSLGQTEPGDIVEIEREDGTVAKFEITKLERRSQSDFPTAEVYGDIDYAGLRLITCTGIYDHGTLRYSHNLIVYAKLVAEVKPDTAE